MLHRTCTVWYTVYQSALGRMVIYESFQAKVCTRYQLMVILNGNCSAIFLYAKMLKNTMTMQRGRTSLAINGMPPWTSSEQKPGLTAYERMLHRKGITPSTMMNTGSMEAFRLKEDLGGIQHNQIPAPLLPHPHHLAPPLLPPPPTHIMYCVHLYCCLIN